MNLNEMLKEVKKTAEERDKLKSVVSGYVDHANKLIKIAEDIKAIAKEIDPYLAVKQHTTSINAKEIVAELFDKIKSGTQVDRDFIVRTYPDLTKNNILYIMTSLQKLPGVQKRKDGVKIWMYM